MADVQSEFEMRKALREAYEFNDHARRTGSTSQPYMGSMAINRLCFLLGDFRMMPDLFRAIEKADGERLRKAIEYCEEHGYLRKAADPAPNLDQVISQALAYLNSMPEKDWSEFDFALLALIESNKA